MGELKKTLDEVKIAAERAQKLLESAGFDDEGLCVAVNTAAEDILTTVTDYMEEND